jgi:hypothetical protein
MVLPLTAFAGEVTVPFGTTVLCELTQQVVSKEKDFAEGDVVKTHVWKDVWVGNHLVVKAGTPVYTRISELKKARIAGRKGHLELGAMNVTAVDGRDLPLEGGYDKSGKGKVGLTATLTALVAWPLIFLKGKKAVLEPGTIFDAIVRTPIQVQVEDNEPSRPALQVAPDLKVEVLYDDIDPESVRELPIRLESSVGPVLEASIASVNGTEIPAVPVRLTTQPGDTVTGVVDFKTLSKHFGKGMNRLGVRAGEIATAEVLLEIEF